jgi:hypothetical protein
MVDRTPDGTGLPYTSINGEDYYVHTAWHPEYQRELFGAAGTDSGYAWISEAALRAAFDPLGVAVPHTPMGAVFKPEIAKDTGGHLVAGQILGSAVDFSNQIRPAHTVWHQPNADGDWLRALFEGEPFRIIDAPTTEGSRRHGIWTQTLPDGGGNTTPFWLIWQMDPPQTAQQDGLTNGEGSSRVEVPRHPTEALAAWPSVYSVDAAVPLRLLVSPEPWWSPRWTAHNDASGGQGSNRVLDAHTPTEGLQTRIFTVEPGAMPITADSLRALLDVEWECFHVMAWQLEGVRRAQPPPQP